MTLVSVISIIPIISVISVISIYHGRLDVGGCRRLWTPKWRFSHLIHVPIAVFHADFDSDRVEAKLGRKWLQIDDFCFSLQKCVFKGGLLISFWGTQTRGPGRPAGRPAGQPFQRAWLWSSLRA